MIKFLFKKKTVMLLLATVSFFSAHSQGDKYRSADSVAQSLKAADYTDIKKLTFALTKDLHTPTEKLRSIYRWVAENINYDPLYRNAKPKQVLKKGSAVCFGYSNLFAEMCKNAGLQCEVILGFSKNSIDDINNLSKKPDHSWNAVMLNGKWQLLDVTWGSAFYNEKTGKTTSRFHDTYFLMEPKRFILSHYPKESVWQLLDTIVGKNTFSKWPLYYSSFYKQNQLSFNLRSGVLKLKMKDSLRFEILSEETTDSIHFELADLLKKYTPVTTHTKKLCMGKQKFNESGDHELVIYLNREAILGYKIRILE